MQRFTCGSCVERFRSGLITLFLVLNGAVVALAQTADAKPSARPEAGPGIAVGTSVVLKSTDTPLTNDGRLVPIENYLLSLKVERVDGDRVLIVSRDGKKRGWIGVDQVVPRDRAIAYFDGAIAKDPKNADAYWSRGRLWWDRKDLGLRQGRLGSSDRARVEASLVLRFSKRPPHR